MLETSIVRGSVKFVGMVHGAMNTIVTLDFNKPDDWEFKQFISEDQLQRFATENELQIVMEKEE